MPRIYCGKPGCGLNRGQRCIDCEQLRVDHKARLLFEQGRLMAERRERQDFYSAGQRTRRLAVIEEELAWIERGEDAARKARAV